MNFDRKELRILRRRSSPAKIQDFLNKLPFNFEKKGETCYSPKMVLKFRTAHCMEGAMFAAAALRLIGHPPLVVDLRATKKDFDHVIAVFKIKNAWGAISKTNHAVLRYREPIYRDIRELVMSYFHEYFLDSGRKTLREYSDPFDLSKFDPRNWMTSEKNLFFIPDALDRSRHYKILTSSQLKSLRNADAIEIKAGKMTALGHPSLALPLKGREDGNGSPPARGRPGGRLTKKGGSGRVHFRMYAVIKKFTQHKP